jgi:hypothetical protein
VPLSDSCTAAIVSNRLYHAACEPGAKSILAGLQLGLDAALAVLSLDLMGSAPAIAIVTLALLLGLLLVPRYPSALIALAAAIALAQVLGVLGKRR